MASPRHNFQYRTTEDKLERTFAELEAEGHEIVSTVFKGGRDYVIVCRQAGSDSDRLREAVRDGVVEALRALGLDALGSTRKVRA